MSAGPARSGLNCCEKFIFLVKFELPLSYSALTIWERGWGEVDGWMGAALSRVGRVCIGGQPRVESATFEKRILRGRGRHAHTKNRNGGDTRSYIFCLTLLSGLNPVRRRSRRCRRH